MTSNKGRRGSFAEHYIGSPDPEGTCINSNLKKAQELSYFHPNLTTMEEVKQALVPYIKKEGSFIIRMSITQQNMLTVSVTHQRTIKHFKIQQKFNRYYLEDKCFDSLEELVKYYGNCDVPNVERVEGVRLIHPIDYSGYTPLLSAGEIHRSSSQSSFADADPSKNQLQLLQNRHSSQPPPPQASTLFCGKDLTASTSTMSPGRTSNNKPQRPPIPLPEVPAQDKSSTEIYNGLYYSHIKEENLLPTLLEELSMDSKDVTHCECGLDMNISQLPQGWSVHICHDQNTYYGCPFFMDSSNVTSWVLPDAVYLEMNHNQKKLINLLNDNFNETKQPPDNKKIEQWMSLLREEGANSNTSESRQHSYAEASNGAYISASYPGASEAE